MQYAEIGLINRLAAHPASFGRKSCGRVKSNLSSRMETSQESLPWKAGAVFDDPWLKVLVGLV